MIPTRIARRSSALPAILIVTTALLVAGCRIGGGATASFDPATPCNGAAQQGMIGAYPDLEARVPAKLGGVDPSGHESGRFCSKESLGTVWDAGIHEVQYGGAVFALGQKNGGVQAAVWRAPGLTAQRVADEYRAGAAADSKVAIVAANNLDVNGRPGFRMDIVNGESREAIVVWPSADGAVVQLVIAADVDESVVQEAIAALG